MANTFIADNEASGIAVIPTSPGTANAVLSRVEIHNGSSGIRADGTGGAVNVTIADSIVAGNSVQGISSTSAVAPVNVMVVRSIVANNGFGLFAGGNSTFRIGASTVTGNTTAGTMAVLSYGDNNIDGNVNGDPALPTIPKK